MTRSILSLSLLATTALVSPAAAEITPAEVWQDLRGYMESTGYSVSGTESGGGDALTVNDVVMTTVLPEDAGTITMEVGTVMLTTEGDAVSVDFPDVMPIRFDMATEEGGRATGVVEYRHTDLEMQVSGSATAPRYAYASPEVQFALTDLEVDGQSVPREAARVDVTMSDLTGTTLSEIGATRVLTQEFAMGRVAYDVFFANPDGNTAQVAGAMESLTLTGSSDMPLTFDPTASTSPFALGILADADFTHGGGQLNVTANENGNVTAFTSNSASGGVSVEMNNAGIGYGVTSQNVTLQLATPDVPFPVAMAAAETAFSLSGPMRPTETAEAFDLLIALRGFEMADMLWNMFDPGNALPRDPATLELALNGAMRPKIDFFDEAQVEAMGDEIPAELETLELSNLTLDVAGALLTGTGAFRFNNDDLESFDGFPAPVGEINLELSGANALIDTLVGMGVLPQDQAMGARMMMSMFTQPAGDDLLTSKIEITDNGQILANGQRLQ